MEMNIENVRVDARGIFLKMESKISATGTGIQSSNV